MITINKLVRRNGLHNSEIEEITQADSSVEAANHARMLAYRTNATYWLIDDSGWIREIAVNSEKTLHAGY